MKIKIAFKHFPSGGKFMYVGDKNKYYVKDGNKDRRLPKFIWELL